MKVLFANKDIEDLALRGFGKHGIYKKLYKNKAFLDKFFDVLALLRKSKDVNELSNYRRLNYERLAGDLLGCSSVRVGYETKYRLIFTELENGICVNLIEISEHYEQ